MTVFNSSTTWAAALRLGGYNYKCMLVIFVFPFNPPNSDMDYRIFSVHILYGLSYACVYTQGLGTPTASQHNLFDSEKLKVFLVLLTGFEPSTFGSPVQRSNH